MTFGMLVCLPSKQTHAPQKERKYKTRNRKRERVHKQKFVYTILLCSQTFIYIIRKNLPAPFPTEIHVIIDLNANMNRIRYGYMNTNFLLKEEVARKKTLTVT